MKRIGATFSALGLAVGLALTSAPAATAAPQGWACDTLGSCGVVTNSSGSLISLAVTCNLGNPWLDTRTISPGQTASCKDSDGFYARKGYAYSINSQRPTTGADTWIKVNDATRATVRITRAPGPCTC